MCKSAHEWRWAKNTRPRGLWIAPYIVWCELSSMQLTPFWPKQRSISGLCQKKWECENTQVWCKSYDHLIPTLIYPLLSYQQGFLGCIILPKVLWYIDSPPDPIILTTKSSPSEKNWKKFHFKGPGQRHLGYVYAVLSKALPRKSFRLKILLAMLQMTRFFKILHYHGPKFEIKFWFELCHQWGRISGGHF